MGFWDHDTEFYSKQIVEFRDGNSLSNPSQFAPRISSEYDDPAQTTIELLTQVLQDPMSDLLEAIVIGPWGPEMYETPPNQLLETLIAAAPQLPSLKAIFWGDITSEECEVSWINQTDLSPIFSAFPNLEVLRIRGGSGLNLGTIEHDHLTTLIVETGGLDRSVVQQIAEAKVPSLEHLELFFGDGNYGGNATIEDAKSFLSANKFPKLTHFAMRNASFTDDIAEALVESDILPQLKRVDLSLGTLGDRGGQALLESAERLSHLELLDLHYHYMSESVEKRFSDLNFDVIAADGQGTSAANDRYVSIGE